MVGRSVTYHSAVVHGSLCFASALGTLPPLRIPRRSLADLKNVCCGSGAVFSPVRCRTHAYASTMKTHPDKKKYHALFSFCAKPVISRQKADGTMRFCVFDGSTEAHFGGGCEAGWRLCLCISLLNGGESPSPLKKAKCCSAVRRGAISGRQMLLNALHINDPSS